MMNMNDNLYQQDDVDYYQQQTHMTQGIGQHSSIHPLTGAIRRSSIHSTPLPPPSVYIVDNQDGFSGDAQHLNTTSDQWLKSPQQEKHSISRKKSMDILSKIGLRRHHAASSTTSAHTQEHDTDNDSSSDEQNHLGSINNTRRHRQSLESTRSFVFNANVLPPHGERYIKIKSKAKTQNKALSKLVLAQTLTNAPNSQPTNHHLNEQPQHHHHDSSLGETANGQRHQPQDIENDNYTHPNRPHNAIWAMKFSKDGKYLAAGGQNCVLRVWEVLSDKTTNHDISEDNIETIKVFNENPIQEYHGHKADILDISWSKNNFLLSSSMDKTVRLWHVSNDECLCVFVHLDFVTGIKFHPKDDRFFLSGSLDSKLRLWSIPDKKVAFWNEVPNDNLITAVGFTLDGRTACVGSYTGQVYFYETQGLKYNTQINVKKRGAKVGKKITGLEAMPNMPPGEEKLLITSNDSRIRMINMKDKSLIYKYKGLDNSTMQIKATFNDDGRYIICGSEDCSVYLWPTGQTSFSTSRFKRDSSGVVNGRRSSRSGYGSSDTNRQQSNNDHHQQQQNQQHQQQSLTAWLKRGEQRVKEKLHHHHEFFEGHRSTITNAVFAPHRTRQQLACTGNDIILNHTPIPAPLCLGQTDSDAMRSSISLTQHHETKSYLYQSAEDNSDDNGGHFSADHQQRNSMRSSDEMEYLTRQYDYPDSQIIATSDVHGCIQVWRTDSGVYPYQQQHQQHQQHQQQQQKQNQCHLHPSHINATPPPASLHKRHSVDSSVSSIAPTAMISDTPSTQSTSTTTATSHSVSGKPSSQKRAFTLFSGRSNK
ncbi:unnamed protein product [Absidia cylindrospora]